MPKKTYRPEAIDWETPHPDHAWQVYTRDFGINTPAGVLIGKYRYEPRWGDEEFAIEALEKLGATIVGRVARGAVEGGDRWLLDESPWSSVPATAPRSKASRTRRRSCGRTASMSSRSRSSPSGTIST